MSILNNLRTRYAALLSVLFLLVNAVVRCVLLAVGGCGGDILRIFSAGLLNDLLAWGFLGVPAATLTVLWRKAFRGRLGRGVFFVVFGLYAAVFLFTGVAEYFFWDEVGSRFNFIAVDYLIYTTEVVRNILESYPIVPLLAAVAAGGALAALACRRLLRGGDGESGGFLPWVSVPAGLLAASALFLNPVSLPDRFERELAYNGVWSLFHAYRHNQIDYRAFYPVMDSGKAFSELRSSLRESGSLFPASGEGTSLRWVDSANPTRRLNVIEIVVESLGSRLLGEDTPVLNGLIGNGLSFSGMYATGTRTVRGIEALTLSVPPTPGVSIVRRPGSEGMFNVGTVFREKGYDTCFLYGGYGYFDNMNAFFASNGFRVVDRSDEDLFAASLREADACAAAGRPFFQFVLTTSNHRPFTYPDGKVSVPSGTGRRGAVQYTDYAIGRFLEEAAKRPWFADTVFVITGDHTSGAAGRTDLPPERYHIPAVFYSPYHVAARRVDTLCSQIDVAPTLFDLLGWDYSSLFFGRSALALRPEEGRAWISTYQLLGFMTQKTLVVMEPLKKPLSVSRGLEAQGAAASEERGKVLERCISSYQSAYDLFNSGGLKETHTGPLFDVSAARTSGRERIL